MATVEGARPETRRQQPEASFMAQSMLRRFVLKDRESWRNGGGDLDQCAVWVNHVGDCLAPWLVDRVDVEASPRRDRALGGGGHVLSHKGDRDARWWAVRVETGESAGGGQIGRAQRVRRERERGFPGVEFAVVAFWGHEALGESERCLVEVDSGSDVVDVKNRVSQLHSHRVCLPGSAVVLVPEEYARVCPDDQVIQSLVAEVAASPSGRTLAAAAELQLTDLGLRRDPGVINANFGPSPIPDGLKGRLSDPPDPSEFSQG